MDGLSPFGTFYRIVLPLSLPGLSVIVFYSFITAWNEFLIAITFLNAEDMYTLPIGLQQFVNQFNTDWNYMSAGAIICTKIPHFWSNSRRNEGIILKARGDMSEGHV